MTAARRTNQSQRPGAPRSANDENITSFNDLTTGKAITLVFEGMPFPIAIKPLQNLELLRVGEFDRSEQWHRIAAWQSQNAATIRRMVSLNIGESLMADVPALVTTREIQGGPPQLLRSPMHCFL